MGEKWYQSISKAVFEHHKHSAIVHARVYLSYLLIHVEYRRIAVHALCIVKKQRSLHRVFKLRIIILYRQIIIIVRLIVNELVRIFFQLTVVIAVSIHRSHKAVYLPFIIGIKVWKIYSRLIGKNLRRIICSQRLPVMIRS